LISPGDLLTAALVAAVEYQTELVVATEVTAAMVAGAPTNPENVKMGSE